jgi:predicted  nucleic acid-binding Zn-ribbon protein
MCGNRVEELESRVQELEASVEGLTDELIECKVRLRELENAAADQLGSVPEVGSDTRDGADELTEEAADRTKSEPSERGDSEGTDSDIIVA